MIYSAMSLADHLDGFEFFALPDNVAMNILVSIGFKKKSSLSYFNGLYRVAIHFITFSVIHIYCVDEMGFQHMTPQSNVKCGL